MLQLTAALEKTYVYRSNFFLCHILYFKRWNEQYLDLLWNGIHIHSYFCTCVQYAIKPQFIYCLRWNYNGNCYENKATNDKYNIADTPIMHLHCFKVAAMEFFYIHHLQRIMILRSTFFGLQTENFHLKNSARVPTTRLNMHWHYYRKRNEWLEGFFIENYWEILSHLNFGSEIECLSRAIFDVYTVFQFNKLNSWY